MNPDYETVQPEPMTTAEAGELLGTLRRARDALWLMVATMGNCPIRDETAAIHAEVVDRLRVVERHVLAAQ